MTNFGPAHAGEKFAAHFAVAWAAFEPEPITSWFAVDTSAAHIIAGARSAST